MNVKINIPSSFENRAELIAFAEKQIAEKLFKRVLKKEKLVSLRFTMRKFKNKYKAQAFLKYGKSEFQVIKIEDQQELAVVNVFKSLKRICSESINTLPKYDAKRPLEIASTENQHTVLKSA